ncbi:MAG: Flp family type IVb pilin [Alphaproteobacteria bacterium]|nr:Flp family type IVb pilin [Alphaproteobacteria bacterium]MDE1986715.1 Flp family type IVb pilin [Alphaproteobacteria bacterium]MDE2161954.1 Flp family type IVb pilin [Alphaproteobacteria bacterium]MDE2264459.1 Flp family type IVb pilin [Alphaproteobacteria bacterium]MDE2500899.1 Flp family type IVb pilin [Alphaproteobacteria bacterium]
MAFLRDSRGATAIEYALIASLVSIAIVAGLSTIGTSIKAMLAAITF